MKIMSAAFLAVLLAGCVKDITSPDGRPAHFTRCGANACYERLAATCPSGYDIFGDNIALIAYPGGVSAQRDIAFTCR